LIHLRAPFSVCALKTADFGGHVRALKTSDFHARPQGRGILKTHPAPACRALPMTACALCLRVFAMPVDVGILLWSDIAVARVFKGALMHRREYPAVLATAVVSFSA